LVKEQKRISKEEKARKADEKKLAKMRQTAYNALNTPTRSDSMRLFGSPTPDGFDSGANTEKKKRGRPRKTPSPEPEPRTPEFVTPSVGKGIKNHTKVRAKTTDFKRNIRFLIGSGMTPEPLKEGELYRTKCNNFVRINKMMLDTDALNNNQLVLKYVSNRNICPSCPRKKINDAVKEIIFDIVGDNFYMEKYQQLNTTDKQTILSFAETCHCDIGITSSAILEEQMKILVGEYDAGNSNAIEQLHSLISNSILSKQISTKTGLDMLRMIVV